MTSIVEVTVPAHDLALAATFRSESEVVVESVEPPATGGNGVQSVLAVEGTEDIHEIVAGDPTVESATAIANLDGECVLRVAWTPPTVDRLEVVYPDEGAVLRTRASGGTWCLRVLFGDRTAMESWYQGCCESALSVDVESVHDPTSSVLSRDHGLSEKQYEVLESALRQGFYDVPRGITLRELADEFDVSHQALSERLARAHRATISNVVSGEFPVASVE